MFLFLFDVFISNLASILCSLLVSLLNRTQLRPGSHSTDQSGGAGETLPRYVQQVQEIDEYLSSLQATNAQTIRARQERTQNERSTTGAMPPLGRDGGSLRSETTSSHIHNATTSRSPASIDETRHATAGGGRTGGGIGGRAGTGIGGGRAGAGGRTGGGIGGRAGTGSGQAGAQQPGTSTTPAMAAAARNLSGGTRPATSGGSGQGHGGNRGGGTQRQARSRARVVRIDRTGDGAMGDILSTVQSQSSSLDSITSAVNALSQSIATPVVSMRSLPDIFASINDANARFHRESQRLTLSLEPAEYVAQSRMVEMIREEIRLYQMELQSLENFMRRYQDGRGGGSGGGGGGFNGGNFFGGGGNGNNGGGDGGGNSGSAV